MARACRRAGRAPGDVLLVAVTKTVTAAAAAELAHLGQVDLGENRLPSLEEKRALFAEQGLEARWHFVGHVQRNKARRVARLADVIHSVDTTALIETLARVSAEEDRAPWIYLQVALTGEAQKAGFDPAQLAEAAALAAGRPPLRLAGLMAMAPREGGVEAARAVFRRLRELGRELPPEAFADPPPEGGPRLSMGMSGDYEAAVEEGAHVLRVGTALLAGLRPGPRDRDGSGALSGSSEAGGAQ